MHQRRSQISDGVFWGLTATLMAGIMGGAIGYVLARFNGAGSVGGGALGALVFVVAAVILGRTALSTNLPPPNTLKAPVAPPGGAFPMPPSARPEPGANSSVSLEKEPAAGAFFEHAGDVAGHAVGKAVFGASAAVTSAAEAARAAIADIVSTGPEPEKPPTLDAPRDGAPDDLKRIKGLGPKLEGMLHGLGYYHFDQIASWGPAEIAWVDSHLDGFNGRASRDDWVGQARLLADGGATEFSERVDRGEVY